MHPITFAQTRMHSSRMCTVCCSSRLLGGGALPRGCLSMEAGLPRGVSAQGMSAWRGAPPAPTPCGQNSQHTLVKTLPLRNFVADGKKSRKIWQWGYRSRRRVNRRFTPKFKCMEVRRSRCVCSNFFMGKLCSTTRKRAVLTREIRGHVTCIRVMFTLLP